MKEGTNHDIIEAWLDGLLSLEEQSRLEAKLREDPEFAAELAAHKATRLTTQRLGDLELRAELKTMLTELDNEGPRPAKPGMPKLLFWQLLAGLLLLLLAGAARKLLFDATPAPTPEIKGSERHADTEKDSLIADLTADYQATRSKLDSLAALQFSGQAHEASKKVQELRRELERKDAKIRQLVQQNSEKSNQEIALLFYKRDNMVEDNSPQKRGGAQRLEDRTYAAAAAAFDKGNYAKVIPLLFPGQRPPENNLSRFQRWLENDSTMSYERLNLMGQTYFCLQKIPEAVACFERIRAYQTDFEAEKNEWMLFLFRLARPQQYRQEIRAYINAVKMSQDSEYKPNVQLIETALIRKGLLQ